MPVSILQLVLIVVALDVVVTAVVVVFAIRRRNLHLWLHGYLFPNPNDRVDVSAYVDNGSSTDSTDSVESKPIDVFIAVCDHFEPECGGASVSQAMDRTRRWCDEYPRLFSSFQDCNGRVPQHTFFYPQEEYKPEYLDALAELCGAGFGDVDVHLHHDNDTAESLRDKLDRFRETLYFRHGLLRRDPITGEIVYGFIHGNWALCNSRPDGRWCGVDNEITILRETGCYADFTMPSAPSDTQTRTINSIYYAVDQPGRRKSHDAGIRARVGDVPPPDSLLMIQGPLSLDWSRRKFGIMPRIENADMHAGRPADWHRMQLWLRSAVHVAGQPNWLFVKLHTHGCKDGNIDTLLSGQMQQFHQQLSVHARANPRFRYHYVTAWEMAQLVHQAEAGAAVSSVVPAGEVAESLTP